MGSRRVAAVLAVPAGVVASHAAAYAVAGAGGVHVDGRPVTHAHFGALVAAALGALGAAVLAALRAGVSGRAAAVPPGWLAAGQAGAFLVMELAEAAAGGEPGAALRAPTTWVGLAAGVAVTVVLTTLLRAAVAAGSRLARRPPVPRCRRRERWGPSSGRQVPDVVATPESRRGPPAPGFSLAA
jgi:hypothetical protein